MKTLESYKQKQEISLQKVSEKIVNIWLNINKRISNLIRRRKAFDYAWDITDYMFDSDIEDIENDSALMGLLNDQMKKNWLCYEYEEINQEIKNLTQYNPFSKQVNEIWSSGLFRFVNNNDNFVKAIPKCKFKTFQLLFTPPDLRILPVDYKPWSIENDLSECIVDPSLIPDWVLDILWVKIPQKMSDFDIVKLKEKHIPDLKKIFESDKLKAISIRNYNQSWKKIKDSNHSLYRIDDTWTSLDWDIIYCKWESDKKPWWEETKIMQKTQSAYRAYRQTEHIWKEQGLQSQLIASLISDSHYLHSLFLNIQAKQSKESKDIQYQRLTEIISPWIEKLMMAKNYYKVNTFNKLIKAFELINSESRKNPSAASAVMVTEKRLIWLRTLQLTKTRPRNTTNTDCISRWIIESEAILLRFHEELKYICANITDNKEALKNWEISTEEAIWQLPNLKQLKNLKVKPFKFYAEKLVSKFEDIKIAMENWDYLLLREEVIKTYVISKIFVFQKKLQDQLLIVRFLDENHVSSENIISNLELLLDFLKSREIFPKTEVASYKRIYDYFIKRINSKINQYKELNWKRLNQDSKRKLKGDFVNFLQSFEIWDSKNIGLEELIWRFD